MPKISIKTDSEIAIMAEGGQALGKIVSRTLKKIKTGVSTAEIDQWVEEDILAFGGEASFKRVPKYYWTTCVGLNNEVVHSIPKKDKIIKEGDLVKIDAGIYWKGFNNDVSWTTIVPAFAEATAGGQSSKERFLEAGKEALKRAISAAKPGNRVGHISMAIQETIESAGFSPVKILTGHGIGRQLHESPLIPCFLKGRLDNTAKLLSGMTLAIEVIYSLGSPELVMENDNWTISTRDGKIAGLFEETIAVCENGPLILAEVRE